MTRPVRLRCQAVVMRRVPAPRFVVRYTPDRCKHHAGDGGLCHRHAKEHARTPGGVQRWTL